MKNIKAFKVGDIIQCYKQPKNSYHFFDSQEDNPDRYSPEVGDLLEIALVELSADGEPYYAVVGGVDDEACWCSFHSYFKLYTPCMKEMIEGVKVIRENPCAQSTRERNEDDPSVNDWEDDEEDEDEYVED
jgi:hypothetical protein